MKYRLSNESLPVLQQPTVQAETKHVYIESGVELDTVIVDARTLPSDPTILFFLPWSEFVTRPDATDRYRLLATAMSARVVALDNLGMGPHSHKIPAGLRHDIERGDFGSHERIHIEALHQLSISLAEVSLMGYSLGTSLAARFARELDGYGTVNSMMLAESVGITRQHTVPLMRKFSREMIAWARDRNEVQKIHPDWMPAPTLYSAAVRHMALNVRDYMAYPRGLATAPILDDVRHAYGNTLDTQTPIRIINGGGSVISMTSENERFVSQLEGVGFANITHDVYDEESHGVIDVPRKIVAMYAAKHQ